MLVELELVDALLDAIGIAFQIVVICAFGFRYYVSRFRLTAVRFGRIVLNLNLELVIAFDVDFDVIIIIGHARLYPRGSSTTASTVSSLMRRNSLPNTLKRVPE